MSSLNFSYETLISGIATISSVERTMEIKRQYFTNCLSLNIDIILSRISTSSKSERILKKDFITLFREFGYVDDIRSLSLKLDFFIARIDNEGHGDVSFDDLKKLIAPKEILYRFDRVYEVDDNNSNCYIAETKARLARLLIDEISALKSTSFEVCKIVEQINSKEALFNLFGIVNGEYINVSDLEDFFEAQKINIEREEIIRFLRRVSPENPNLFKYEDFVIGYGSNPAYINISTSGLSVNNASIDSKENIPQNNENDASNDKWKRDSRLRTLNRRPMQQKNSKKRLNKSVEILSCSLLTSNQQGSPRIKDTLIGRGSVDLNFPAAEENIKSVRKILFEDDLEKSSKNIQINQHKVKGSSKAEQLFDDLISQTKLGILFSLYSVRLRWI